MGPISRENFYFVNRVVGHSLCSGSKISGRPNFTISPIFVDISRKPLLVQTVHAQKKSEKIGRGSQNAEISPNLGYESISTYMSFTPIELVIQRKKKRLELSSTTLEIKILENCEKKVKNRKNGFWGIFLF